MTSTSQIWFSTDKNGKITAQAFWKDANGNLDTNRPGEFKVSNGSFKDFGIKVPDGYKVNGFTFDPKTGQNEVIFKSNAVDATSADDKTKKIK